MRAREAVVSAIAAEPGTESAWIALAGVRRARRRTARALFVHVSAEGKVLESQMLPSDAEEAEGVGPKGAAEKLSCPATNDCWLATTQGWLFHLAPENERTLPLDEDPNFDGAHHLPARRSGPAADPARCAAARHIRA